MRKQLYLHIGPHKTGTTSLQYYLNHNRANLSGRGWLYPKSGCPKTNYGHHEVARSFLGRGRFDISVLRQEIDRTQCRNILLSSEDLSLCRDPDIVANALSGFDVKIVIFLRRQDELLLSMFNQGVKTGSYCGSLPAFASNLEKNGRLNHYELCERWAAVFGEGHVIATLYRPDHSVIVDFFGRLGIDKDRCADPPRIHANRSVDPRLIGAMKMIRKLGKEGLSDTYCNEIIAIIRSFESRLNCNRTYSLMNVEERQRFLARYRDSNLKLFDRFVPGESFEDPAVSNRGEVKVGENFIHHLLFKEIMSQLAARRTQS